MIVAASLLENLPGVSKVFCGYRPLEAAVFHLSWVENLLFEFFAHIVYTCFNEYGTVVETGCSYLLQWFRVINLDDLSNLIGPAGAGPATSELNW